MMSLRIGNGFDSHNIRLCNNSLKPIIIGNILISSQYEVLAHSDGDVLLHALIDSILGALSKGDIGEWFSDQDGDYKDISSEILLKDILLSTKYLKKWKFINIDTNIILENPKISLYKGKIKKHLAYLLSIDENQVSIKAKTSEGVNENQICATSSILVQILS